jgi:hypothetical protein
MERRTTEPLFAPQQLHMLRLGGGWYATMPGPHHDIQQYSGRGDNNDKLKKDHLVTMPTH